MVRYVPIKETVILICSVIVNYMKRIRNTNDRMVDVIVFYAKNIKLQPVPPPMPLEALLIPDNLTDSDSDIIGGGTGCNFIFYDIIQMYAYFIMHIFELYRISINFKLLFYLLLFHEVLLYLL